MASATTDRDEKAMASDVIATAGADEGGDKPRPQPPQQPQPARAEQQGGFFHIYKPGQGYWTRMGTAAAGLLLIAGTVYFLWQQVPVWIQGAFTPRNPTPEQARAAAVTARNVALGVCAATFAGMAALAWWLMNKPRNADFLIATDSEMKKVNWTSRKDLIGSTKVVIFFMFLIAFLLFAIDIIFGYAFYFIDILKSPPF
jgi:preprotein translocase subunit SecE